MLDLEAYRAVHPKIRRITQRPELDGDGWGTARIVGSLWHLPPAPDTHVVHLEPWRQVTFSGAPGVAAQAIYSFTATFEVAEGDQGTRLTRSCEVTFRQPLHALFGGSIQRWLDAELADELVRLQGRLALARGAALRRSGARSPRGRCSG